MTQKYPQHNLASIASTQPIPLLACLAAPVALLFFSPAQAQHHCATDNPSDASAVNASTEETSAQADATELALQAGGVLLSAKSARNNPADPALVELDGDISIRHRDGELQADTATYNTETRVATVNGELALVAHGLKISSASANVAMDSGTFSLGPSGYEFSGDNFNSQGKAESINRREDGVVELQNATYSSCPPDDNGWRLRTESLSLNQESGVGIARNVSLHFKDVPIFYTPIFSFPIGNQRKTGFLPPRFDQTDQSGLEYRQPFYWNIAPNWDTTFLARTMSDRGFQLQTEVRHLNRYGHWQLDHEFIGNDQRYGPGGSRHFTRMRQSGVLSGFWKTEIDTATVSDQDYFEDLGDNLKIASVTHLQQRADLTYQRTHYSFRTRLLSYQTVDSDIAANQRPYQMLPQLTFNYRHPVKRLGVNTSLKSELVFFERDNSVTGTRLDLSPRAEWGISRSGWFSKLATTLRITRYDLQNTEGAFDANHSRIIPVVSADSGLYLERSVGGDKSLLTLEPRLFYLYASRRDQSRLPLFDTGALDFNFSQLFRENRFSGADRINDANQLSVALSSRLINSDTRDEFARASIGQIFYFRDRDVTLPDEEILIDRTSDFVAELSGRLSSRWSAAGNLQWNPNREETLRSSFELNYRASEQRLFNIGHRFIEDSGEFLNTSVYWPLGRRWRLAASANYALDENKAIENILGIEYESCCWAFRTAARRFITDDGDDSSTSYFFQLVLKGLAPVGQNVSEVLEEGIGGYRNTIR